MSFHVVYCVDSSDKVLIVVLCSKIFYLWPLKKCWFDFFLNCGYPPDIHLNALQVLFWGRLGSRDMCSYITVRRLYSLNITQNEALSVNLLHIFAFHALSNFLHHVHMYHRGNFLLVMYPVQSWFCLHRKPLRWSLIGHFVAAVLHTS